MRQYEPVWVRLKQTAVANGTGECTVEVKRIHATRVKKAVIKEKTMDEVFKRKNRADPFKLEIIILASEKPDYLRISFKLFRTLGIL